MNTLLASITDAHGGLARWRKYERVEATIVSGGGLFALKGVPQSPIPRRVTVWLHEQRFSISDYGAADQRAVLTPERVAIEKSDGTLVAERHMPRDSFAGHQMNTPWDPIHRAYFSGYALWTYLTSPFVLARDDVRVEELESWVEGAETWRCLRAYFPGSIETHSLTQEFFFDAELRLRRHDYRVNIAGGFAAAQLISNYVEADGIRVPTQRRAYVRGPDGRPVLDMLMVWIDFTDVIFG
jgi:hypothetical protein